MVAMKEVFEPNGGTIHVDFRHILASFETLFVGWTSQAQGIRLRGPRRLGYGLVLLGGLQGWR